MNIDLMARIPTQDASSALDVRTLRAKAHGTLEEKRQALRQAARQFEAVFIYQMVRAMRKTVGEGGLLHKGNGERIFEGMLDEEWSKKLASKTGPNGLSELLYRQLSRRLGLEEEAPRGGLEQLRGAVPPQLQREQVGDE